MEDLLLLLFCPIVASCSAPENVLISHYEKTNKKGELWIEKLCKNNCKQGGVFLWGDSHAHALAFGLKKILDTDEYVALTTSACAPSIIIQSIF